MATVTIIQLKLGSDLSSPKYALAISMMKNNAPDAIIQWVSRVPSNGVTLLMKYPMQKNVKYVPPRSDRGIMR